uniref:Uncharacterized protein n=1 Tax=Oryza punctata TaxID=4537 RepID=A0A0E0LKA2_ORYPU
MTNEQREERNRKQHGVTQEETIRVQAAKTHIPDDTYIEFDSGLFEPPLIDFVDEDHGETAQIHDMADSVDELHMQFQQSKLLILFTLSLLSMHVHILIRNIFSL